MVAVDVAPATSARPVPRRLLLTLLAYIEEGSHKAAAHRLAIAESTCRQRVSLLMGLVGARTAAEAVWRLRRDLDAEMMGRTVRHDASQGRAGVRTS